MQLNDVRDDLGNALRKTEALFNEERALRADHECRDRDVLGFTAKETATHETLITELQELKEKIITLEQTYKELARGFHDLAMQDRVDELREALK
jgi:hypothetical protein